MHFRDDEIFKFSAIVLSLGLIGCASAPTVKEEVKMDRFAPMGVRPNLDEKTARLFVCGSASLDLLLDSKKIGRLAAKNYELYLPTDQQIYVRVEGRRGQFIERPVSIWNGETLYLMVRTVKETVDVGETSLNTALGFVAGALGGVYMSSQSINYRIQFEVTGSEDEYRAYCNETSSIDFIEQMVMPKTEVIETLVHPLVAYRQLDSKSQGSSPVAHLPGNFSTSANLPLVNPGSPPNGKDFPIDISQASGSLPVDDANSSIPTGGILGKGFGDSERAQRLSDKNLCAEFNRTVKDDSPYAMSVAREVGARKINMVECLNSGESTSERRRIGLEEDDASLSKRNALPSGSPMHEAATQDSIENIAQDHKSAEILTKEAPESKDQSSLEKSKRICSDLGFQAATEKYGECVLRLLEKNLQ